MPVSASETLKQNGVCGPNGSVLSTAWWAHSQSKLGELTYGMDSLEAFQSSCSTEQNRRHITPHSWCPTSSQIPSGSSLESETTKRLFPSTSYMTRPEMAAKVAQRTALFIALLVPSATRQGCWLTVAGPSFLRDAITDHS